MNRAEHRSELFVAGAVALLGVAMSLRFFISLWTLDANGLSSTAGRLPYWDFTNLWAGSLMALRGHVAYLFDVGAYRNALRSLLSPLMPDQEWSYPPSMLLIGAPFALLPVFHAYILWTFSTLLALYRATGLLGLSPARRLLVVIGPAAAINVCLGQNGALTAALLIGGLCLAPRRPAVAGMLLGLLTIKPQLGLIVPFCLVASGKWRAIGSATVTALILVLVTGWAFGFDVWLLFLTKTRPLMTAILEAPYPQDYQINAMTVFMLVRALGFDLAAAYGFQLIVSAAACLAVAWLWRAPLEIDHAIRVALTGLLALIATPYGYTYDAIPVSVAIAVPFQRQLSPGLALLAIAWLYPLVNQAVTRAFLPLGIVFPAIIAALTLARLWKERRLSEAGRPQAASAP